MQSTITFTLEDQYLSFDVDRSLYNMFLSELINGNIFDDGQLVTNELPFGANMQKVESSELAKPKQSESDHQLKKALSYKFTPQFDHEMVTSQSFRASGTIEILHGLHQLEHTSLKDLE